MVQLSQRRSFCGDFKVSPYAADHNLLPHLQNIYRDGTARSRVSSYSKTRPRPPFQDTETITTSIVKVRHTSQDHRVVVFPWQKAHWLRASCAQRNGKDFPMTRCAGC